jgi:geranylgeranylglycerol-phosphate geranylgeranyltransferase
MFSTSREKFTGVRKLIRAQNILPTLFLSFTGGYIQKTLATPQFAISTAITALIMSTSMILNDLFDIELDRTNNPRRPLITGEVTKPEAIAYAASMILAIFALKTRLPQTHLRTITNISIITITLYTPVLKRIPFVKNIACASLVAFSLFFAGNSLCPTPVFGLATQHLFVGSLYNEILLDMCDKVGDKANGVYTLPVLFGDAFTVHFIRVILTINALLLCYRMNMKSVPILLFMTPLYHNLFIIRRANYSPSIILDSAKQSSKYPLLLSFLYFCFLSRI